MEKSELLKSLPLFKNLSDDHIRRLAQNARQRQYQADEIICYQGDPGSTCHVVIDGRVRVFVMGEEGRELSVRIMGPGEIFGEMALLEDLPRSASIQAMERTQTLELRHETLFQCLQESPQLALNLLQSLSERLRSSTIDAEELASLTVVERLIRQLHDLADISGKRVSDGVRVMLPMTQQDLAALVGTSRESVNRALVRLRRQGRVRLEDGWIVLLDEKPSA